MKKVKLLLGLLWMPSIVFSASVVGPRSFELNTDAPRSGQPLVVRNAEAPVGELAVRWYRGTTAKVYDATAVGTESAYTPTPDDYEHWLKCVVTDDLGELGTAEVFVSKLPVVYMTTDDGKTPSSRKEGHTGRIRIQGNDAWGLQFDGVLDKVSVRGNSTSSLPKKPYKIKLAKKTALFGIPKSKHWVLLANYYDESNMRNKIAYDLSGEMGLTQMRSTWVDVVLNGQWLGLYQLCEHIRVDSERVDVYNWEDAAEDLAAAFSKKYGLSDKEEDALIETLQQDYSWVTDDSVSFGGRTDAPSALWKGYSNDITGGYLFELSDEYDELSQFTVGVGTKFTVKTMLNAPEYLFSNASMMDYCKNLWQDYWDACTSATGYNSSGRHYSDLSDIDSMAAYWLTMEVMGNNDASYKSRYAYKDRGGKLIWGPAWDFDWGVGGPVLRKSVTDPATGEMRWAPYDATGWKVSKSANVAAFYREWADDPWFCLKIYEKYWAMRSRYAALVEDGGLIDRYAAYLAEAGAANEAKWKYRIGFGGNDGDVAGLKTYLSDRLEWLDGQFSSLETLMSSLKTTLSASPYAKNDKSLSLASSGVNLNLVCPTDYFVPDGADLSFTLTVKLAKATRVDAYLDGLKYKEAAVADGVSALSIPSGDLARASGGRRMVQFVAVDAGGAVLARNYATVLLGAEGGVIDPSAGVKGVEVVASTPEQAMAQIDFAPPVDDGGRPVVSSAEYASYFKVSAVKGDVPGAYFVSAELNAEKLRPELNQALREAFADATVLSAIGSPGPTEVMIGTRPGLYYSLLATGSLHEPFSEGARKLAIGSSAVLEVPLMGSSGFYRINVSAAPGLGD